MRHDLRSLIVNAGHRSHSRTAQLHREPASSPTAGGLYVAAHCPQSPRTSRLRDSSDPEPSRGERSAAANGAADTPTAAASNQLGDQLRHPMPAGDAAVTTALLPHGRRRTARVTRVRPFHSGRHPWAPNTSGRGGLRLQKPGSHAGVCDASSGSVSEAALKSIGTPVRCAQLEAAERAPSFQNAVRTSALRPQLGSRQDSLCANTPASPVV